MQWNTSLKLRKMEILMKSSSTMNMSSSTILSKMSNLLNSITEYIWWSENPLSFDNVTSIISVPAAWGE